MENSVIDGHYLGLVMGVNINGNQNVFDINAHVFMLLTPRCAQYAFAETVCLSCRQLWQCMCAYIKPLLLLINCVMRSRL